MESFLLTLREPITQGAQEKPDLVEGITLASAVSGRVLLDAAAHLTWGITGECDDEACSIVCVSVILFERIDA